MAIFPAEWHFDGVESGFCRQNVVSTASNQHSADKMAIRRGRIRGIFGKMTFPPARKRRLAGKALIRRRGMAVWRAKRAFRTGGNGFYRSGWPFRTRGNEVWPAGMAFPGGARALSGGEAASDRAERESSRTAGVPRASNRSLAGRTAPGPGRKRIYWCGRDGTARRGAGLAK